MSSAAIFSAFAGAAKAKSSDAASFPVFQSLTWILYCGPLAIFLEVMTYRQGYKPTWANKKKAAYVADFSRFPVSSRTIRRVPDRRRVSPFLLGCWSVFGDLDTKPEGIIDILRIPG